MRIFRCQPWGGWVCSAIPDLLGQQFPPTTMQQSPKEMVPSPVTLVI